MFKKFRGMFSNDLSIDLGTANTLIFVRGQIHAGERVLMTWSGVIRKFTPRD